MTLSFDVQHAAEWLQSQINENAFCNVGISLVVHSGTVTRTEKTITIKTKPENGSVNYEQHKQ